MNMDIRLKLRKPFLANAFYVLNITNGVEFSMLPAIPDDALSQDRADSRQTLQLLYRTAINIDVPNICHRHGLPRRESFQRRFNAGLPHEQGFSLNGLGRVLQQARKRQKPHGPGKEQEFDSK